MNTIIIHPNNRVARTSAHDLSAALIAPVSPWYRKPTPWWIDTFEEVRLHPIVETDEILEESEVDDLADELSASSADIALEQSQQGPDISEDIASDDIIFDDEFHGMGKDGCYDFFEDAILVDEVDNDNKEADDDDDDDDTLMDITLTGENTTFRLRLPLSIAATKSDSEDEGEDDTIDWFNQFLQ